MSGLRLNLLGPFEALDESDRRVDFPTIKAQALFAYLMVEDVLRPGASHSRGALMTLLWPDITPKSAQNNLRQTLYRLRRTLPDLEIEPGKNEPFLLSDRQNVWVNPKASYRMDLGEFEQAHSEADGQAAGLRAASLARAVSLYRGDFLSDVYVPDSEAFENWARQVREAARQRVLQSLEETTNAALAAGDTVQAQEMARRQIAIDDLNEIAHRQLMRSLADAGQRSAALNLFDSFQKLLMDELGVEPSNETLALAEAIRKGKSDQKTSPMRTSREAPSSVERQSELILLEKVHSFWIKGVLERSLHGAALIELGMESTPSSLAYPWDMVIQRPDQSHRPIPTEKSIAQIFDESGHSLLILGAPGAGKTTTLLELARVKISEAKVQVEAPLPVVFNLSSWSDRRMSIADWMVEELNLKYLIPKRIAQEWVMAGRLLILLDGLDEVLSEDQAECVSAVNAFRHHHGLAQIAVCSRSKNYDQLPEKLQLSEAVRLLPLARGQAQEFLRASGDTLGAVADMLERDAELETLALSPLMLSIIALVYRGASAEDLASLESASERRKHILAAYVDRMFVRRGRLEDHSPAQTTGYLGWLARSLSSHGETVFLLEQLQPDWLSLPLNRWLYALSTRIIVGVMLGLGFLMGGVTLSLRAYSPSVIGASLLTALFLGVLLGLADALGFHRQLAAGRESRPRGRTGWTPIRVIVVGLLAFLMTVSVFQTFGFDFERASGVGYGNALVFGLVFGFRGRNRTVDNDIRPIETIQWSWNEALRGSIPGALLGIVLGLLDQYVTSTLGQNEVIVFFAALGGLLTGLVSGLRTGVVTSQAEPNEGLRLSFRYGVRVGLAFGIATLVVFTLILGLIVNRGAAFNFSLLVALQLGVMLGLLAMLWHGGIEVLHHAVLRLLLRREGNIPPRYPAFLDQAVDLIFLRRVGGGYIFTHQLLQDYFARNR